MLPAFIAIAITAAASDNLTTSYANKLRADIATANRIEIESSPELGGKKSAVEKVTSLVEFARAIPGGAPVTEMKGKLGTVTYIIMRVYDRNGDEEPSISMTVMPDTAIFKRGSRLYSVELADDSLFRLLSKQVAATSDADGRE